MPRPKKPGAPEPKRRSRNGCWPCKNRKIKCGEEHPACLNCQKAGEACDYSIRLNWDGRKGKRPAEGVIDFSQELTSPSSSAPAKGFRLVHGDASKGKRLEPLEAEASSASSFPSTNVPDDSDRRKRAKTVTSDLADDAVTSPSSTLSGRHLAAISPDSPLTGTSSAYSDEDPRTNRPSPSAAPRRPSLHSGHRSSVDESARSVRLPSIESAVQISSTPVYYGLDRGFPDLDLDKNDDGNAITGSSPLLSKEALEILGTGGENEGPNEFGFGVETTDLSDENGYYSQPVSIYIPRNLMPLPPKLSENPMNLMYFHHFLNHTARVLVPYDDPHANPFRIILPQMAVHNDGLLALLLAYSASHRARVLNQPEPVLRIALWVNDIFPSLRHALDDPGRNFSRSNLATAIMLTSLEIVSPQAFGYDIPWQRHLSLARELITSRPGGLREMRSNFRDDPTCSFLWSWAAYLDVIASFSSGSKASSSGWIFDYEYDDIIDGYDEIDCIMGFTTRCIYLLANIADLAKKCDGERIGEDRSIRPDWRPSSPVLSQAQKLESGLFDSLGRPPVPCKHIHTIGDVGKWDRTGLMATNEAFHWAAMVHLYRRVMGRPSDDGTVQNAVIKVISCFGRIPPGGSAASCLLFPLFTAGCEARDPVHREHILERFKHAELHGMTQVRNARRQMLKVWETGKPWETLGSTEFIG